MENKHPLHSTVKTWSAEGSASKASTSFIKPRLATGGWASLSKGQLIRSPLWAPTEPTARDRTISGNSSLGNNRKHVIRCVSRVSARTACLIYEPLKVEILELIIFFSSLISLQTSQSQNRCSEISESLISLFRAESDLKILFIVSHQYNMV